MKNKHISLPISFSVKSEISDKNSRFINVTIDVLHTGLNYNGSIFNKEVVDENIETIKNTPILGFITEVPYDDKDFKGHEYVITKDKNGTKRKYIGEAFGMIPESCNPRWITKTTDSGVEREFLQVDGILWSKFQDAADIMLNDIEKPQSMELYPYDIDGYENEDGDFVFSHFSFDGCCILGSKVEPAMENAKIEIVNFTMSDFVKSIQSELSNKYSAFTKLVNDTTFTKSNEMVNENNKGGIETMQNTDFSTVLQMFNDISYTISQHETVEDRWGDKYPRYYAVDIQENEVIVVDRMNNYNYFAFSFVMNGDSFMIDSSTAFSELIATGVMLIDRPSVVFSHGNERYVFSNVSEGLFNGCLYFEQIDTGYYIQVDEPQVGKSYYLFKPDKVHIKPQQNWKNIEYISCPGYTVFEVDEYKQVSVKKERRPRAEDNYKFVHVGSWISVNLEKGYSVYWSSNVLNSDLQQVTTLNVGQDGKTYFRIKPASKYLSGDIIIRDSENNDVYTEQISHDFVWDGERASYHMNGWGEITDVPMNPASISRHSSGKHLLQNSRSTTIGADILLQILYDIADKNGCVSSRKMVAALEFALSFHGVVPTPNNKKSVIYALRRLGYMISYYDVDRQEYVNQLLSSGEKIILGGDFNEKSNYSFNLCTNAYFVKGVYNAEALEILLHNTSAIYRKRPYEDNVLVRRPEYACLPDVILFEPKGENDWTRYDFQISDYMIATMQSMDKFEKKFMDDKYANQYRGCTLHCAPSMIKDGQGREILCIRKPDNSFVTYKYYSDGVYLRPIPKHLARVYVQNKRKMPVGIINWNRYNKTVDYSKLSFVSGMGVPEVLDIALCDTNLGMPSVDEIFVVNQKELGIDSKNPTTERRIYSTNATNSNNFHVLEVIRKLSAREVTSIDSNPEVIYIAKNLSDSCYKMYLEKKYAYNKDMLLLYFQSDLLAFSLGREVYYLDPVLKNYRKVLDEDVNSALSKIYKNQKDCLQLGDNYSGIIPHADSYKRVEIPIIDRQTF